MYSISFSSMKRKKKLIIKGIIIIIRIFHKSIIDLLEKLTISINSYALNLFIQEITS